MRNVNSLSMEEIHAAAMRYGDNVAVVMGVYLFALGDEAYPYEKAVMKSLDEIPEDVSLCFAGEQVYLEHGDFQVEVPTALRAASIEEAKTFGESRRKSRIEARIANDKRRRERERSHQISLIEQAERQKARAEAALKELSDE